MVLGWREGAGHLRPAPLSPNALALGAIIVLRYRMRGSIALGWVLVAETVGDTVLNVVSGTREHLFGAAVGVTWLVVSFYVPLLIVSLGLVVWQLYSRRGEPLQTAQR